MLGLDIWERYFERVKRGEDDWYFVMQPDEPERIDRVVELAEAAGVLDSMTNEEAPELIKRTERCYVVWARDLNEHARDETDRH